MPSPIGWSSMRTMGTTPRTLEVMNASSAAEAKQPTRPSGWAACCEIASVAMRIARYECMPPKSRAASSPSGEFADTVAEVSCGAAAGAFGAGLALVPVVTVCVPH